MEHRLHKEGVMTGVKLRRSAGIRGFTLIEMLVVVGIISLTAAVMLPNIAGYIRAGRIRAAQDAVSGALQRARNVAIMKNTQMGVTFITQDNSTYWVHVEDTIAGVTAGDVGFTRQGVNFAAPNNVLSTRYILPAEVEFAANAADCPGIAGFAPAQASVRFDRYGQMSLPGVLVGTTTIPPVVLDGGSTTVNRIYAPAGTGDRSVCLVDRRTGLRRWLQISTSGRIVRRP